MSLEEMELKLTAVFEPAPEGGYTCHFEELPEVFSEGETLDEAKANLLDALTQVCFSRETQFTGSYSGPQTLRFERLTIAGV